MKDGGIACESDISAAQAPRLLSLGRQSYRVLNGDSICRLSAGVIGVPCAQQRPVRGVKAKCTSGLAASAPCDTALPEASSRREGD